MSGIQTLGVNSLMNTRSNIISGPDSRDYWSHNSGLMREEVREEGPFPIQGNIGSLLKQEAINNFESCGKGPDIGSSPNCSGVFDQDIYTSRNTCQENCDLKYPESYGIKDFGFVGDDKFTNNHQVHAYENIRTGMAGQMDTNDCYEWIPRLSSNGEGACAMKQEIRYSQVGDWNLLPQYSSLTQVQFKK